MGGTLLKCARFADCTLSVFVSTAVAAGWLLSEVRTQQQKVKVGDGLKCVCVTVCLCVWGGGGGG